MWSGPVGVRNRLREHDERLVQRGLEHRKPELVRAGEHSLRERWCQQLLADRDSRDARGVPSLDVVDLLIFALGNAETRRHHQRAVTKPVPGVGELAHMGPRDFALLADTGRERNRCELGVAEQLSNGIGHWRSYVYFSTR